MERFKEVMKRHDGRLADEIHEVHEVHEVHGGGRRFKKE